MPLRRTIKNVVKNYSDAQVKVREATSNDPWGPSSTLMMEIADLTYNVLAFTDIMQMIWKRLNDHGRNWRHVYKALVLLEYIVKTGSEKVAQQCRENIFTIQTLKDFQYVEDAKDHGLNIREKAKQLVSLLKDSDRLKNERAKALKAKERFAQTSAGVGSGPSYNSGSPVLPSVITFPENVVGRYSEFGSPSSWSLEANPSTVDAVARNPDLEAARPTSTGEEELQLQLALAMSKEEHEQQMNRLKGDEVKLQLALEQSRRDQKAAAATSVENGSSLFDVDGATAASAVSDPWKSHSPVTDPWGLNNTANTGDSWPANQTPHSQTTDFWTTSTNSLPAWPTTTNAAATSALTDSRTSSPWESPSKSQPLHTQNTNSFVASVNDEFDQLNSRPKSGLGSCLQTTGGCTAAGSNDPWNMDALNQSISESNSLQPPRGKSPKDFLGENANLVNLDNLMAQPKTAVGMNPFAVLATSRGPSPAFNPFTVQQQADRQTPLNQITTGSSPFMPRSAMSQQQQSTILNDPTIAAAAYNSSIPRSTYPPGYNPFL